MGELSRKGLKKLEEKKQPIINAAVLKFWIKDWTHGNSLMEKNILKEKTNLKAVTEQEQRNRLCFATKHVTQFKPVHFSNAWTMRR